MRAAYLVGALSLMSACSSTPKVVVETQTVRDYVEVGELEDVQAYPRLQARLLDLPHRFFRYLQGENRAII